MSQRTTTFVLAGGENHAARPVELKPGELLFSENYEPALGGGYRLCDGFERFDGRTAPSTETDPVDIEALRDAIAAVPGEGAIRGVHVYNATVYAFRDNVGATACKMFKSTSGGWVEVVTGVTLNPGGRYRFVNTNFYGSASSYRMYGCDGENKAFEFDGTTFTQITTGMTDDRPTHIAAHKKHLFLAFRNGSLQHSSPGDPTTWSVVVGAGEIGTGDEITGLVPLVADVLGVWNRNSTYLLYGSSVADWEFRTHDAAAGAIENSLQLLGGPKYLDDRGLVSFDASDRFGDFEAGTFSQKVNPIMDLFRGDVADTITVREKNHYRLFRSDGYGLTVGLSTNKPEFTRFNLGKGVSCVARGEAADGTEVIFFGSTDGYVYQLDSGTSWDGEPLIGYLRLAFGHFGDTQRKKRFRKVTIDFNADAPSTLSFSPDFDYSHPSFATSPTDEMAMTFDEAPILAGGGYWGFTSWSDFYWSSPAVGIAEGYVDGSGVNFGLVVRSESTYVQPHTLRSVSLQFDIRGLKH